MKLAIPTFSSSFIFFLFVACRLKSVDTAQPQLKFFPIMSSSQEQAGKRMDKIITSSISQVGKELPVEEVICSFYV